MTTLLAILNLHNSYSLLPYLLSWLHDLELYFSLSSGTSPPCPDPSLPREILLFLLIGLQSAPSPTGPRASLNHLAGADCIYSFPTPLGDGTCSTPQVAPSESILLWILANTTNPTFVSPAPSQEPAFNCFLPSACHRASEAPHGESSKATSWSH